jgi:NAD(P)-dependent dehydrogenase (short-subunit alcohol dehydrogenase family)
VNTAAHPQALVLGASGTVGFGVVGALLEVGSPVLAVGRDGPRMRALSEHFAEEPGLELMHSGCIFSDDDAAKLVKAVRARERPVHAVFASLTSPLEPGRLLDKPADALRHKLEMDLIPHLAAARALLPLLSEYDGAAHYVMVGGPFAERGWAGYGHSSVTGAAMRMMAQVLHEEAQSMGVRVQLLSIDSPICTPSNSVNACAEWPTALSVGRSAVSLLSRPGKPRSIVSYSPDSATQPTQTLFPAFAPPLPTTRDLP